MADRLGDEMSEENGRWFASIEEDEAYADKLHQDSLADGFKLVSQGLELPDIIKGYESAMRIVDNHRYAPGGSPAQAIQDKLRNVGLYLNEQVTQILDSLAEPPKHE